MNPLATFFVGAAVAFCLAAVLQGGLDSRAVNKGIWVHKGQPYRLEIMK